MTDFSDIYETDNGMTLPEGVHVFARDAALGNVTILEDTVVMHRIEPTDSLPESAVRQASIAVVEIDSANPASLARLEMLRSMRPDMPVIAGLVAAPVSMVRSLLRKGVSDVLELPFSSEELVAAIIDVSRSSAPAPSPVKLAPVVAVLGTAGGTGATTVATQLAPLLGMGIHFSVKCFRSHLPTFICSIRNTAWILKSWHSPTSASTKSVSSAGITCWTESPLLRNPFSL